MIALDDAITDAWTRKRTEDHMLCFMFVFGRNSDRRDPEDNRLV